jgi:hypothetical protein
VKLMPAFMYCKVNAYPADIISWCSVFSDIYLFRVPRQVPCCPSQTFTAPFSPAVKNCKSFPDSDIHPSRLQAQTKVVEVVNSEVT